MEYRCRECGGVIWVDLEKLAISPRVQCPRCGHVWRLRKRPARGADGPQPATSTPVVHEPPLAPAPPPRPVVTVEHSHRWSVPAPAVPSEPAPRRRTPLVLVVCGLALLGGAGWWWSNRRPSPVVQSALKPVVAQAVPTEVETRAPTDAGAVLLTDDVHSWMSADFVLVNPTHYAVALAEKSPTGGFQVLAKAEQAQARMAVKTSWESAVPIIAGDPQLARNVFTQTEVHQSVSQTLRAAVETHWRHHEFVPAEATLVAYNDLGRRERRVGFRRTGGEGLEFRDLLGTRFEQVPRELIQPGTLESNLGEEQLAETTDFLDVSLFHICRRLASPDGRSSYLQVVVNPVQCEGEAQEAIEAQISQINLELDALADEQAAVARRGRQTGVEDERPDLGHRERELEARKHDLQKQRELTIEARRLTGEIRAKLAQVGVPLLERTVAGLAAIGVERSGVYQRPDFETAEASQLLGATHLVLADIRLPARQGRYELSMRCVSVATSKVLWDGQGDRLNAADAALDLAGSPYLLNSGRLSVLTAAEGFQPTADVLSGLGAGGWPLLGPAVELVAASKVTEEEAQQKRTRSSRKRVEMPWRPATWLGYVESGEKSSGGSLIFRDLFRKETQSVQSDWVGSVRPVESLTQVPEEHRLRYVVWRLAQSILPLAGRISRTGDARQVEVSLRRQDGVRQGDRLVALRPTALSNGLSWMDVPLPVELILTAVHEHGSLAYWNALGQGELQDGDLAHRKPRRRPMVGILELTPDLRNVPAGQMAQILREMGNTEPELQQFTEYVAKQLTILLQEAFVTLQVPVVERENLDKLAEEQRLDDVDMEQAVEVGRLLGATHLVLGRLSPGLNDQTAVSLRVVAVDTGMIDEQIKFNFSRAQMEGWKP